MTARALLLRATGLNLSKQDADRAVARRMETLGVDDAADYLRNIAPAELNALIELVVVPESWMFRDADAFDVALHVVRERLAGGARVVRIASIPCAGGEEPYSMAMTLADAGVDGAAVRIDGYDLSAIAVARARAGRYTRNAFRGRQLGFRERHFTCVGDEFQISETLRRQVHFSQGNLLALDSAAVGGRYDILFCRNLLIYFDEPTTTAAIARLDGLLTKDGVLLAGYAEVPSFCRNGFTALRVPGAFALKKTASMAAAASSAAAAATAAAAVAPAVAPALAQANPSAQTAPRSRAPTREPSIPATPPKAVAVPPIASKTPSARKAAAPAPDAQALLAQARKLADAGDYRAAADACRAVLAFDADSADAYYLLGMVSECEQKTALADDYWRRCIYLQPNHYEALCHLALLAEQTGNATQAAAFKQRAARIYQREQLAPKGRA